MRTEAFVWALTDAAQLKTDRETAAAGRTNAGSRRKRRMIEPVPGPEGKHRAEMSTEFVFSRALVEIEASGNRFEAQGVVGEPPSQRQLPSAALAAEQSRVE